ncbi:uncharacterized protein EV420DRAFT_1278587, partial [Desarmillaria tabescens]
LIGALQKINTSSHVGGELESTILMTFNRGANLCRWVHRPDCPELIVQFKRLFDKAFGNKQRNNSDAQTSEETAEHAYHTFQGITYSRSTTHLGGSLVLYYPTTSSSNPIAGSIQRIVTEHGYTSFYIQRQKPLPNASVFDPFARYTSFPAKVYLSDMSDDPEDKVSPKSVLCHVAHYNFSHK